MFSSLDAEDLNPLKQTFYHLLIITRSLTGTAINQISDWNKVCVLQENCRKGNITVNLLWYSRGVISQWGQVVASWLYDLNSWIAVLCLLFDDACFLLFYIWYILDPGCGKSLTQVCVPAEWSWPLLRLASKRGVTWKIYRGMQFAAKNQWSLLERRGYTFAHSAVYMGYFQVHWKSQNM